MDQLLPDKFNHDLRSRNLCIESNWSAHKMLYAHKYLLFTTLLAEEGAVKFKVEDL